MKDRLLGHSFRAGILSALLVAAGLILSVQGCVVLRPPGRVVQPPAPVLDAPPFLYVIPGTYAYFVADVDADIFFYQGYWYRPYGGRWYSATVYNGPWTFIVTNQVPPVLRNVPPTYRRVPPSSGRLPSNDVRNNWRTWERERYWDRHDERKRDRYEEEGRGRGRDYDRDRGRDRDEYRDNGRDSKPPRQEDRRGLNRDVEPQVQHQTPPQGGEHQGQIKDEDQRGREQNVRRGQEGPSGPVRQLTQPQVQQLEKKQTPLEKQQDRKKDKDKDKSKGKDKGKGKDKKKDKGQGSDPSRGGGENGRDKVDKEKGRAGN